MNAPLHALITTDAVGGVWTYSLELARAARPLGIETTLAVLGPPASPDRTAAARRAGARLLETGLPLDWVSDDPSEIACAGRALARLADEVGADLVQLSSAALAADAAFDRPVVAVQHSCVATWWDAVHGTELPPDFAWRADLVRAGLAAADAVVTPSAAFAEAVRGRYGLAAPPAPVHNGRAPLRLTSAAPHDFAFTAGRLWDAGKNVTTLDEAAARIAVPVYAAGPAAGPNGASVAFENLHCVGNLGDDEVGSWLARRPVFVSAALYEPFGLAVLEAAMAGCPLVLSDIPTFRELWDGAALFVPATDAVGFARAIAELVGDDFLRAAWGRKAKARAARYTVEAMATKMALLYRSVLAVEPVPDAELEAQVAA